MCHASLTSTAFAVRTGHIGLSMALVGRANAAICSGSDDQFGDNGA